ncbi:hypothetical protein JOM56_009576 [Amanita muscaria]
MPSAIHARRYHPNDVAAVVTLFRGIPELSQELHNTAARAILCAGKKSIGIAAQEINALQKTTMADLLDAVCTHKCITGGIKIILHSPSAQAPENPGPENMTVEVYTSPCELKDSNSAMADDIANILLHKSYCTGPANPWQGSTAYTELEMLLQRWCSGKTYWKKLTVDELKALNDQRKHDIEGGKVKIPTPRKHRSNYGKKHCRGQGPDASDMENEPPSRVSKKFKSAKTINTDSDGDDFNSENELLTRKDKHNTLTEKRKSTGTSRSSTQ